MLVSRGGAWGLYSAGASGDGMGPLIPAQTHHCGLHQEEGAPTKPPL